MITHLEPLYGYRDVTILPAVKSSIRSRSECNPFTSDNCLPLFTAPMTTVVGLKSEKIYKDNNIIPIIPRSIDLEKRLEKAKEGTWIAVSLAEFENLISSEDLNNLKICIDVANGHMKKILEDAMRAKLKHPKVIIMAGNIANPRTIIEYCAAGIDYARVGIGGGSGCITTSNTSIGAPMASLINDTRLCVDKCPFKHKTKIIADGGIRGYGDVIKALALGADYVMVGGLLAGCLEAEGDLVENFGTDKESYIRRDNIELLKYENGKFIDRIPEDHIVKLYRPFYGMASKKGQTDISGCSTKTSEGIEKIVPVTITIPGWVKNMESYLRSSMSYMGITSIDDMYEESDVRIVSPQAAEAINK